MYLIMYSLWIIQLDLVGLLIYYNKSKLKEPWEFCVPKAAFFEDELVELVIT